ncbi:hypothetical protein BJ742DRAFT_780250 [Cladochytrium replicatum]|nr:hypothetical protein BJ742DRAFT_780250 [Cladochytrium replicatum]
MNVKTSQGREECVKDLIFTWETRPFSVTRTSQDSQDQNIPIEPNTAHTILGRNRVMMDQAHPHTAATTSKQSLRQSVRKALPSMLLFRPVGIHSVLAFMKGFPEAPRLAHLPSPPNLPRPPSKASVNDVHANDLFNNDWLNHLRQPVFTMMVAASVFQVLFSSSRIALASNDPIAVSERLNTPMTPRAVLSQSPSSFSWDPNFALNTTASSLSNVGQVTRSTTPGFLLPSLNRT